MISLIRALLNWIVFLCRCFDFISKIQLYHTYHILHHWTTISIARISLTSLVVRTLDWTILFRCFVLSSLLTIFKQAHDMHALWESSCHTLQLLAWLWSVLAKANQVHRPNLSIDLGITLLIALLSITKWYLFWQNYNLLILTHVI